MTESPMSHLAPVAGSEAAVEATPVPAVAGDLTPIKPSPNLTLPLRLLLQWRDRVDEGISLETANFSTKCYRTAGINKLEKKDAQVLVEACNFFYRKMASNRRVAFINGEFRPWSNEGSLCSMV